MSIQTKGIAKRDVMLKGLAEGGQVTVPFGPTFRAKRFSMAVDK